jgi:hypothetical protein
MKKIILALCLSFSFSFAQAGDLPSFLKACAYGTLAGAMAGVVSLALTDKPDEHGNNVARGASLGLYAGIAYGLLKKDPPPSTVVDPYASLAPVWHQGRVDGAQVLIKVGQF